LLERKVARTQTHNHIDGFGCKRRTTALNLIRCRKPRWQKVQSAPASAKACNGGIVSSRSGLTPCKKFSARAANAKGNERLRAAHRPPVSRRTARSKRIDRRYRIILASSIEPPARPASRRPSGSFRANLRIISIAFSRSPATRQRRCFYRNLGIRRSPSRADSACPIRLANEKASPGAGRRQRFESPGG